MAWTDPRAWPVGYVPTAADFNLHVRDQLLFLFAQVGHGNGLVATFDPRVGNGAAVAQTANRCVYSRVLFGTASTSALRIRVGTSSGNIAVAVYDNNGGVGTSAAPSSQLQTSGSVACPGSGAATVNLGGAVMVPLGSWMALSANNATATFYGHATGTYSAYGFCAYQDTAHPPPATATPVANYATKSHHILGA